MELKELTRKVTEAVEDGMAWEQWQKIKAEGGAE